MHMPWRTLVGLLAASSIVPLVACEDSLHLDPPASSGGGGSNSSGKASSTSASTHSTGSTGHGGGGHAPTGCQSNPDCALPTPVCDTVTGKCEECLVVGDCAATPGTVCSAGKCQCPNPNQDLCTIDPAQPKQCVDTSAATDNCGQCGYVCFPDSECVSGKCADPWEPLPTTGAPTGRAQHTAVWTGTTMIVWGGVTSTGPTNTGAIYDPSTRTCKPTSTTGAPSARSLHTAVWDATHKKMLVWGGLGSAALRSGAMYDPAADQWTAMTLPGAPTFRYSHTAVMAGSKMIVWGGTSDGTTGIGDGALFDTTAAANPWSAIPGGTSSEPSQRFGHTAVFSGGQMVVWGGRDSGSIFTDGARFAVQNGTWVTTAGAPLTPRAFHTAQLTSDGKMLIWGGEDPTFPIPFPTDGAAYDVANDGWTPVTGSVSQGRTGHTAVMVGSGTTEAMLIWGGHQNASVYNDGRSLDYTTLTWADSSLPNDPSPRHDHTAVSDGTKMYIFGGQAPDATYLGDGAVYDSTFTP
jgi:hypothetical protein